VIRRATADDAGRLVEMGQRFVAETEYSGLISAKPECLAQTVASVLENPNGVVLVSGSDASVTGMIAMLAYNHPFSGERTAFEVVWWVEPESRGDGVRLLRAAEDWAKEQGATAVQMVAPNERVGALYARLGYAPVETSFQRSL
jgi:GNAT superfamily N-acetyltransferase